MCSPSGNDGLVRYPTVLAPAGGVKAVTVQCADNANNTTLFMTVWCDTFGGWKRVFSNPFPRCQCNSGYRIATVGFRQICQGLSTLKKVISSPNVPF